MPRAVFTLRSVARSPGAKRRFAFTLLEVVLALALSVLVMMLVGLAIDLHVTLATTGRQEIEEAQLARALLRQFADDLRSTLLYSPQDMSGLTGVAQGAASGALGEEGAAAAESLGLGGSESDASSNPTGQSGTEAGSGATTGEGAAAGSGAAAGTGKSGAVVPAATPGLYGTATELQIDISRVPRVDEYQALTYRGRGVRDVPSDVKTVGYYLSRDAAALSPQGDLATSSGGLVRRSLDRAVSLWAAANGHSSALVESAGLVAPQVADVHFAYFDGAQWTDSWDSEAMGGLPLAVEITLVLAVTPPRSFVRQAVDAVTLADEPPPRETIYRQVVHLPAAKSAPAGQGSAATDDASADPASMEEPSP